MSREALIRKLRAGAHQAWEHGAGAIWTADTADSLGRLLTEAANALTDDGKALAETAEYLETATGLAERYFDKHAAAEGWNDVPADKWPSDLCRDSEVIGYCAARVLEFERKDAS